MLDYSNGTTMSVSDDGKGFDAAAVMEPGAVRTAWGLAGRQERSSLSDAKLTLRSTPGHGTTLTVNVNGSETE
jgi:signal transduction histidine kinase